MTDTLNRSDTLLGICEALGEDGGFDPLLLRIAPTAGMLWNPLAMIGGYLMAGLMIAVVRRLIPAPKPVAHAVPAAPDDHNVQLLAMAA